MSKARTQSQTRWLSTREAAAALGVHERTLRRYMSSGLLGCRRLPGGHYRIPEEAIHEFWGAGDAPERGARRRQPGAERPSVNASGGAGKTRSRRARRPRVGDEDSVAFYDLSPDALAALRAQVAVSDG
jgi:excisionase family DNA binding protein